MPFRPLISVPITYIICLLALILTTEGITNESAAQFPWFGDDWTLPHTPCSRPDDVRDAVLSIVRQGGWDRVFVITGESPHAGYFDIDNSYCVTDGYSDVSDMAVTTVTCDFQPMLLARAISSVPHSNGDYFNIVTDCDVTHIMYTMKHIPKEGVLPDMRFNLLFINLPLDGYRALTTFFKDGDNVVIVESHYRNQEYSKTYPGIDLHWCLTDCYKAGPLRHVGPITSAADISNFPVKFLPKRFDQFFGRQLLVAYQEYKPYTYTLQENGTSRLTGIEVELVRALSQRFNFTYVRPPDSAWGTRVNDTYWNGIIGMVMRGDADLGSSSMSMSAERAKVVDYLHPYREESSVMATKLNANRWGYFVNVFAGTTLLAIAALPPFMALVITAMAWAYRWIRVARRPRSFGGRELGSPGGGAYGRCTSRSRAVGVPEGSAATGWRCYARQFSVFANCSFLCYGQMFLQGHSLPHEAGPVRLVIAGYWITVIILTAVYMGNLTASLAIRDVRLPFNTLYELARDTQYILVVEEGTHKEQLFREAKGGLYRDLWRKVMQNPQESLVDSLHDKFSDVMRYSGRNKYVFTASKLGFMEKVRALGACDVTLLREEYLKGGTAFVVKEGVSYKKAFDKALIWIQSSGLVDHWTKEHLTRDACPNKRTQDDPVSMDDLTYVFLTVLAVGLGVAVLALIVEWIMRIVSRTIPTYKLGSTSDETFRKDTATGRDTATTTR